MTVRSHCRNALTGDPGRAAAAARRVVDAGTVNPDTVRSGTEIRNLLNGRELLEHGCPGPASKVT